MKKRKLLSKKKSQIDFRKNTKSGRWKKVSKYTLYAILGLVVAAVVGLATVLGWIVITPLEQAIGDIEEKNEVNREEQINVLIGQVSDLTKKSADLNKLYFLKIIPSQKSISGLEISTDLTVSVARGKGDYQLKKVYALGAIADQKENTSLLIDTVEKNFALPVDRYILVDESFTSFIEDKTSYNLESTQEGCDFWLCLLEQNKNERQGLNGLMNALKIKSYSNGFFQTNLSSSEFLTFLRTLSVVDEEKFSVSELPSEIILEVDVLGEKKLILDEIKLDFYLKNEFNDYFVRQEHLKVDVFNSTSQPQVAYRASRVVSNLGSEVIKTDNDEEREESLIVTSEKYKNSVTVTRLRDFYGAKVQIGNFPEIERADVKISVGKTWVVKMMGEAEPL